MSSKVPAGDLQVWLAGPAARSCFDAQVQTPEDRARWERLANPQRRAEWEVSRALMTHVRANSRLAAEAPLSLSHSAGYAAIATSGTATAVGVDLEHMRERHFLRLARFAFADAEHAQLEALPPSSRAERFYILWTLKEAFAKVLSLPLLQSVSQCTFLETDAAWRASVPARSEWIARVFQPRRTFVLSVVALLPKSARENFRVELFDWSGEQSSPWRTLAELSSLR